MAGALPHFATAVAGRGVAKPLFFLSVYICIYANSFARGLRGARLIRLEL